MAKIYKDKSISLEKINDVLDVDEGGLGTTSLATLKTKLNYIETSTYGQPNGVGKLDNAGKLPTNQQPNIPPPQLSSLDGPKFITIGTGAKTYNITNFSSFYTYTVTVSAGSVTRNNGVITFTPPTTAQDVTITLRSVNSDNSVNSTVPFKVTITASNTPDRPNIIYPANGTVRVGKSVTLESSAFSINGSFTHTNSDWEVSKNATFTTSSLVASSYNNVPNKIIFQLVELEQDTTYYARVRHTASNGIKSLWSPTLTFITVTNFDTSYHFLDDQHPEGPNEYYGTSLILSEDEGFWIAGGPGRKNGTGEVMIHYRNEVGLPSTPLWALKTSGVAPTTVLAPSANFGYSMDIDATGTRLAVGAPGTTIDGKADAGCVYIFRRIDKQLIWSIEKVLTAPDVQANSRFGHSVSMSRGGPRSDLRVVIGAPYATRNSINNAGQVYVWVKNNLAWDYESTVGLNSPKYNHLFGYSVKVSGDATHMFVGMPGNLLTDSGKVIWFRQENDVPGKWHYHGELGDVGLTSGAEFGKSIALVNSSEINDTYDLLIVGAPGANNNKGVVYVYKNIVKINTQLFVQVAKLESDSEDDERFGECVVAKTDGKMIYVGAPRGRTRHSNGGGSIVVSGCVYVYKNKNDIFSYVDKLVGSSRDNTGNFGYSLFAARDPNSKFLLIGDTEESNSFPNTGVVYMFN